MFFLCQLYFICILNIYHLKTYGIDIQLGRKEKKQTPKNPKVSNDFLCIIQHE